MWLVFSLVGRVGNYKRIGIVMDGAVRFGIFRVFFYRFVRFWRVVFFVDGLETFSWELDMSFGKDLGFFTGFGERFSGLGMFSRGGSRGRGRGWGRKFGF